MLRLMIRHGTADDFIQCFTHHQRVAVDEGDERIGTLLDVPNQLGVENELILIEFRQADHADVVIGTKFAEIEDFSEKNDCTECAVSYTPAPMDLPGL